MSKKRSAIEKLQNPTITTSYAQKDDQTESKKRRQEYTYQKLTTAEKIRGKLQEIRVTAACIIDDTYDAEFILNNSDLEQQLRIDDFRALSRYFVKLSAIYRGGLPFFNDYVVEREYEYE